MKNCEVKSIEKKEGLNQKFLLSFEFGREQYVKDTLKDLKEFKSLSCSTGDLIAGIIEAIEK